MCGFAYVNACSHISVVHYCRSVRRRRKNTTSRREDGGVVVEKNYIKVDEHVIKMLAVYLQQ